MLSIPRIVRPDPHRIRGTEFGSPVGPATRRPIKRNKELKKFLRGWGRRQWKSRAAAGPGQRVPASAERLRSPNTPTNICVGQWSLPFFG